MATGEYEAPDKNELFGYKKLLIGLSKSGKVYGIEAWTGDVLWESELFGSVKKILMLQNKQEVAVITNTEIIYLNSMNGLLKKTETFEGIDVTNAKFILTQKDE